MKKEEILERVQSLGLLAVIRGPSPELTLKMVDALVAGGVYGIEITYTTPNAAHVVKELDAQFSGEVLLGMGTLTEPQQADEAVEAGAKFLVSPHYEEELAAAMFATGQPIMMGAFTPAEVIKSYRGGSSIVKLFPGSLGSPKYLKALRGPFPDIPMMPTGGVSAENIEDWFKAGAVAVGAGSALCPRSWAEEGRFDDITTRARSFVEAINRYRNHLE
jgi:2-dehydro-3-deoxyphosphogluconate aldolase/(4S)-4-hydroxy-2-oxoglutarate aldolase